MKKVMFICSDGGHLSELLVFSPLFSKYKSSLVVEKTKRNLPNDIRTHILLKGTRKKMISYMFILLWNSIRSLYIFVRENPDVIVTTGAHTAVPMCLIGCLFRKKIIFIESIARVTSKSMTGKIIENKVSKILVQWPEMTEVYQHAEYIGPIL